MSLLEREILAPSQTLPVLVDFWAPWCGPCRVLGPVLDKVAADAKGRFTLVKVNVDEEPALSQEYRIQSIPAVKLFDQRKVIAEFAGAMPESQVRAWLDRVLPREVTRALVAARAALLAGRQEDALQEARRAHAADPASTDARSLLASLTLFDDANAATALVAPVQEGHEGAELADAVRTLARALTVEPSEPPSPSASVAEAAAFYRAGITALRSRQFDAALAAWIDSMRKSRKVDDDGARRACVALFRLLGESHPTTLENRRAFASVLY